MVPNQFERLNNYLSQPIVVSIQGSNGEEVAPFVKKTLYKVELCPDQTHVRVYFDPYYFVAIPITSEISWGNRQFQALDQEGKLFYRIRKGN